MKNINKVPAGKLINMFDNELKNLLQKDIRTYKVKNMFRINMQNTPTYLPAA